MEGRSDGRGAEIAEGMCNVQFCRLFRKEREGPRSFAKVQKVMYVC